MVRNVCSNANDGTAGNRCRIVLQQMMAQGVTVTNRERMGIPYTVHAVFQSSYRLYAEQ